MSATVHGPGEGEPISAGASSLSLKATGAETGGKLFLSEAIVEPGFPGPPRHVHRELHDMFYVLEGTLTLTLGDDTMEAGPGTFACVPPGAPHTFANRSDTPVRFLNFSSPAGFEEYMRALGAAFAGSDGPPDPAVMGRIASRFDFELA